MRALGRTAIVALLTSIIALPPGTVRGQNTDSPKNFVAVDHQRQTIYHASQTPGYTRWTGTLSMPDGSIMVCFTQATGPVEGRPRGSKEVLLKLSWPPGGDARYDMTGLDLRNVHLRSFDGGTTWKQVSADPFRSPMNGVTGECETAVRDGTVIRGVWGYYLPFDPHLPQTGYLERSLDGTKTWGKPEVLLDPKQYTAWPKRIRQLRDGRLIITGGLARLPANSRTRAEYSELFEPLLLVSDDDGKTWSFPLPVVPADQRERWGGEEFDVAELLWGDLLCVFRRADPQNSGREVRWQGLLQKQGNRWIPQKAGPAPFPHSGHPELLATREGVVLHVATTGIHWSADAGRTWHRLEVLGTHYYPRSVQTSDGRIFIFGHVGGDNGYGTVDQAIVMDRFRLGRE
jgi:hypothetical protein